MCRLQCYWLGWYTHCGCSIAFLEIVVGELVVKEVVVGEILVGDLVVADSDGRWSKPCQLLWCLQHSHLSKSHFLQANKLKIIVRAPLCRAQWVATVLFKIDFNLKSCISGLDNPIIIPIIYPLVLIAVYYLPYAIINNSMHTIAPEDIHQSPVPIRMTMISLDFNCMESAVGSLGRCSSK